MIKFALMKYSSAKEEKFADYSIRDVVENLKGFLSVTPEDFFKKLSLPQGLKYVTKDARRWFEVCTNNIYEAENLMKDFADKFKDTVFQNNHSKPIHYHIIDLFKPGSSEKRLETLATLRYWNIGRH